MNAAAFETLNAVLTLKLSATSKLLLTTLCIRQGAASDCWPSQAHLAECVSLSDRAVRRHLRDLAQAGYLRITGQGKGTRYAVQVHAITRTSASGVPGSNPDTSVHVEDATRTPASAQPGHLRHQPGHQRPGNPDTSVLHKDQERPKKPHLKGWGEVELVLKAVLARPTEAIRAAKNRGDQPADVKAVHAEWANRKADYDNPPGALYTRLMTGNWPRSDAADRRERLAKEQRQSIRERRLRQIKAIPKDVLKELVPPGDIRSRLEADDWAMDEHNARLLDGSGLLPLEELAA